MTALPLWCDIAVPLVGLTMPTFYRFAVVSLGALLLLGGLGTIVIAVFVSGAAHDRVASLVSGVIATGIGGMVVRAGYTGRAPGWIRRNLMRPSDDDTA